MTDAARKKIPQIKMTPDLQAAMQAVPLKMCSSPHDPAAVRAKLQGAAQWFEDPAFFTDVDGDPATQEIAACETMITLATLLREHLKAGNL